MTINVDALNHFSTTNSTWLRLSFFNQNNVYISVNSVNWICTQELLYHCSTLLFKKDILIMIECTFFSHSTKLQKYAHFQITVFTYYLQYISIVFSFALTFSPFFTVYNSFLTMYKFCGKYFRETPSLLNEATFNVHAIIYVTFILWQCCTVIETLHLFLNILIILLMHTQRQNCVLVYHKIIKWV